MSASKWLKYDGNPILGKDYGTCFDATVLEENGVYRLYFSWRPKKSIAFVESKDGVHWSEPVIVLEPVETEAHWQDDLNRQVVVKKDGKYHMWYSSQKREGGKGMYTHSWIFYAKSDDGIKWERRLEPVLSGGTADWDHNGVMSAHVIWDQDAQIFKMWYSGLPSVILHHGEPNCIAYAESKDGINWNQFSSNPVLRPVAGSNWESHKVAGCWVLKKDSWYYIFYIGFRNEDMASIGVARSKNGISNWEKCPENPIVEPLDRNAWDGDACYKPSLAYDGKRWLLWYNGRKGHFEQIGMAVRNEESFGF